MEYPFVTIYVGGEPVAQGRPKFSTVNGHSVAYDPKKSRDYKSLLRLEATRVMRDTGNLPTENPCHVTLTVTKTPPRSWSKKKIKLLEEGRVYPIVSKPDLDNYIKVLDGLNGIVWKDDNQVWSIEAKKVYARTSGLRIDIWEEKE